MLNPKANRVNRFINLRTVKLCRSTWLVQIERSSLGVMLNTARRFVPIISDERDVYLELIQRFPLRKIKSEEELDEATRLIDELLDDEELPTDAKEYLEVLEGLVSEYESEHHDIPPVPDSYLLEHLIEAQDVSQAEVARATGIASSTISAVIAGTRQLTREQIGLLCRYFGISPDTFSF